MSKRESRQIDVLRRPDFRRWNVRRQPGSRNLVDAGENMDIKTAVSLN